MQTNRSLCPAQDWHCFCGLLLPNFCLCFGVYNHTLLPRFWFVFTEPLQDPKIFCLFIGSLGLKVLCCEVAQLHHDFILFFRAWTSSTAPGQTERRVTAQNVLARFNRAHVSVKPGFSSQSTISIFVVHFLCYLMDRILFRTLKSFYFHFAS